MEQQNVGSKRSGAASGNKAVAKSLEGASQVKETVVEQANQIRDRALAAKEHASDRIRGVATQLRGMSDTLREDDPLIANVAERASQGVETVARYVSSATPQSLIRDTERLARRQPALFYGVSFLLGLAAGRFIKSSRPEGEAIAPGDRRWDGEAEQRRSDTEREERSSGFFATPAQDGRSTHRRPGSPDTTLGRESEAEPRGAGDCGSRAQVTAGGAPPPGAAADGALGKSPRKGNPS
jgi:hypothetical protein